MDESSTNYAPITFDWVTIPAGEFLMGSDKATDKDAYEDELPQHKLYLPEYKIARGPVTVAQFAQFVSTTGYKTTAEQQGSAWDWAKQAGQWLEIKGAYWAAPRGAGSHVHSKQNHPVTCVSWHDAQKFCAWAGVRLPSEAEWEKAARGSSTGSETGRIYPWGNEAPDQSRCNFSMNVQDTTAIDHYPPVPMAYSIWRAMSVNGRVACGEKMRINRSSVTLIRLATDGRISMPVTIFVVWCGAARSSIRYRTCAAPAEAGFSQTIDSLISVFESWPSVVEAFGRLQRNETAADGSRDEGSLVGYRQ